MLMLLDATAKLTDDASANSYNFVHLVLVGHFLARTTIHVFLATRFTELTSAIKALECKLHVFKNEFLEISQDYIDWLFR